MSLGWAGVCNWSDDNNGNYEDTGGNLGGHTFEVACALGFRVV